MRVIITILILANSFFVFSQEKLTLSLDQTIETAKEKSLNAQQAQNQFRASYWQYKLFKSSYFPEVSLSATLPNYSRRINSITLDDGSQAFVSSKNMMSNVGLKVNQRVAATGGNLFLNSSLQRIDVYNTTNTTSYLSSPFIVGYNQPLLAFNPYKWERKIAPIQFEESKRKLAEDIETISIQAINYFFNYLDAQIRLKTAENNKISNEELYKISEGRFTLGTIAENELLEMELSVLESDNNMLQSQLDVAVAKMNFSAFLGIAMDAEIELEVPKELETIDVSPSLAISKALENNKSAFQNQRNLIEAEQNYARAKSEAFNVNLFATYGISGQSNTLDQAYQDTDDQQQLTLGVEVPILNWGKSKASREIAKSNLDYTMASVSQVATTLEQQIFISVSEIAIAKNSVLNAAKADTIASKRYEITKQRYKIGTIDVTTFNLARNSKDSSKISYYRSLRRFWVSYYNIRKQTLFDFKDNKSLISE
jgi:outer membrane protein